MKYQTHIAIPVIDGPYRRVYTPAPDVYRGIQTENFTPGERYDDWIANDFSLLKARDGVWHAIGITHPRPPRFADAFDFDLGNVHEAENQLFHATFSGSLRELYAGGTMEEREKLLYPQERPGERPECWAPAVFPTAEGYGMLYSPEVMHYADSADLYRFTPRAALFSGCAGMRDPFVFSEDGVYHILYNDGEVLWRRTTTDFQTVSAPQLLQHNGFGKEVAMESPSLIRRGGMYYLLWCVCDGQNGCYDNRTYVFAAPSLDELDGKAPLTVLRGHAPELVCDADGQWYIASVFYPENGLSLAPIRWEDAYAGV